MSEDALDVLAGEYVLGTLDGAARAAFETRLRDEPAAAAAVAAWQTRLAPLAEGPPDSPPARVWEGLAQTIAPADLITVRADQGAWHELAPGVHRKDLHEDPVGGTRSFLLRFAAGARLDAHDHAGDEYCMMLEGDVRFDDLELRAGDFHLAPRGTPHGPAISRAGALLYIQAYAG